MLISSLSPSRLKNSALRSVSMSCSAAHHLWLPFLLEDFTCSILKIHCLWELLNRDERYGSYIKIFRAVESTRGRDWEDLDRLKYQALAPVEIMDLDAQGITTLKYQKMVYRILNAIFINLPNVETLHLLFENCLFPLSPFRIQDPKMRPFAFWTNSLKTIVVSGNNDPTCQITASNVLWILLFAVHLRKAVFVFATDMKDFKLLAEHSVAFKGLSKVKQLALAPYYHCTESKPKTWWFDDEEGDEEIVNGDIINKKTQVLLNLLLVTNCLSSIEIMQAQRPSKFLGNRGAFFSGCLKGIRSSKNSLKHLRLCHSAYAPEENPDSWVHPPLGLFENLKILGIRSSDLLSIYETEELFLPSTLEVLQLVYYTYYDGQSRDTDFVEEIHLRLVVEHKRNPSLKQVVVPSEPIDLNQISKVSPDQFKLWETARLELTQSDAFENGLKLRVLSPSESGKLMVEIDSSAKDKITE